MQRRLRSNVINSISLNYNHLLNFPLTITLDNYVINSRFHVSKIKRVRKAISAISNSNDFAVDINYRNFHNFLTP